MLSVVMPYWNRNNLLNKTLESYVQFYSGLDMEVIVVDDGSPQRAAPIQTPFQVKVIRLPDKDMPKNPCVPINAGVREAVGEILVLTNPEIYHTEPVFPQMMESLEQAGPNGYVMAACWDRHTKTWYCHSTREYKENLTPPGFGYHFCVMLRKGLFNRAGGFDEAYRDGSGYDDNDFAWALHQAKAIPVFRDDLVTQHENTRLNWGMNVVQNRRRLIRKWNLS